MSELRELYQEIVLDHNTAGRGTTARWKMPTGPPRATTRSAATS